MSININTAISALDTPSSLLPFFIKDAFDVSGRTVMAYNEGGKHEAREKFIEEAGTSLFWIGGIPLVRWIANKLYKNKIDSELHFKRINQEGIQNYFADEIKQTGKNKYSKQELQGIELGGKKLIEIKDKLKKADYIPNKTKGFYKKFHVRTTSAGVLINLVVLSIVIPQLNLYLSRKLIAKEVKNQKNNIKKENQGHKTPSFGALKDLFKIKQLTNFSEMAEKVQLEPVSGMLLLDWGISGSRVTITPRNTNERIENTIKEGGIIFFFYYAADIIKQGLAKVAKDVFKTPINLDYKVLNNSEFLARWKNNKNKKELLEFVKTGEKDTNSLLKQEEADELNVIKMIDKELSTTTKESAKDKVFKNFTLQMAQKEGLIWVEFDEKLGKWIRHSKKYIETEKIISLNDNLKAFYEQAQKASSAVNFEKVIAKTKKLKIASIFVNIAICSASLSFIIPKIQYMIREHRTKTKSAPGILHYQEKAQNNKLMT